MRQHTFIFINLLLLISICSHAQFTNEPQMLAEDNNVLFIKANVLFDSDRYDEAVRMYNRILKDDPSFSRALFMRGKAKFALGAFKGTKKDLIEYISQNGISDEWLEIMGQTEKMLNNSKNALTYFEMLTKAKPYDGAHFNDAAHLHYDSDNRNKACEYWIKSAKLGHSEGAKYASMKCDYNESIHLPTKSVEQEMPPREEENTWVEKEESPISHDTAEKTDSLLDKSRLQVVDVSVKTTSPDVDMDSSQKIPVDDELTIILNSGLGKRKVDKKPNILMLSDQSGRVVIDVCVESNGSVKSAQLNKKLSSIFRSSLTSLAIRKAKEMVFMPSLVEEQCGLMIYDIKTE